ncbi:hypothetical protein GCM10010329_60010 [Streptomyces spiroverticillatus]|uniref:Uncharacterized protein n=1 Tax=Streptomyces finlayi TaxID=67296 RepID=A0A919CDC6_9ACTN|nr:hypothetical protein [Streptomyces finlayi]GHA28773.1 hypothetical protein GCM10010329_60010 [Streptomyces spiroverticillatus]GHD09393.1 hypothetical protein GCM10010334_63670 [Streptomyces finlayi]
MSEYADAVAALRKAERVEGAARHGSSWYARYLLVFGTAQFAFIPLVVLWHGALATAVTMSVFAVMVVLLSVYAARQRTARRHFGLRHGLTIGAWTLLYTATIVLHGRDGWQDSVPLAVGGAVACALPLLVGAVFELRSAA